MVTRRRILLAILLSFLVLVSFVSAASDYCTPPENLTTVINNDGDWWNITITSDYCYTCVDSGYGNISCTACDNDPPGAITGLDHTVPGCDNVTWTWKIPSDADYNHVEIWVNGVFFHNLTTPIDTDVWTSLTQTTEYTISTRTVDDSGNVDPDWENHTINTDTCGVAPVADFIGNPLDACLNENVSFTDLSTNSPTQWLWTFGDDSGNFNPGSPGYIEHPFNTTGLYNISLLAGNAYGDNLTIKYDYINVTDCTVPPSASFTSNVTCGIVPFAVAFNDTSTGGNLTNWSWMFGDGNTSTEQHPVFEYAYTGLFTVNFSVTNSIGTSWSNVSNYMTSRPVGDNCTASSICTTCGIYAEKIEPYDVPLNPMIAILGVVAVVMVIRKKHS